MRAPTPPPATRKRRWDRKLIAGIGLGAGAFVLIVVLAVWLRPKPPTVNGWVTFDEDGKPFVEFRCSDCNADSELSLRGKTTRLPGRLPFEGGLTLGEHPVTIDLKSPGRTRQPVRVPVRVPFLVSGDLSGLGKPKPSLSMVLETTPEAGVIVNGKSLGGNPGAPRRYEIDVSAELTGQESSVKTLERKVPYAISIAGLPPIRGELALSTSIVPLSIEAPGESITVESASFMLAGATQPNGAISVDGRAITVDPSGRFAQLMNVSSVGNTTVIVRASAPGRAPRLAPVRVRRVSSLTEEARSFAGKASRTYASVSENTEKKLGWSVALAGKITEVRPQGFASSLLLAVDPPCTTPPCLVRLICGEKTRFTVGDHISAYGYLARPSRDPQGNTLPEVRVEFLRGDERE
jgi:hypothetical protein